MFDKFIKLYERTVHKMWRIRAGGTLRSLKGTLVETMAEEMALLAWKNIAGKSSRIKINKTNYPMPSCLKSISQNSNSAFSNWKACLVVIIPPPLIIRMEVHQLKFLNTTSKIST